MKLHHHTKSLVLLASVLNTASWLNEYFHEQSHQDASVSFQVK